MMDYPSQQQGRQCRDKYRDAPLLGGLPQNTGCEPELSGVRQPLPPLIIHVDDDHAMLQLTQIGLDRFGSYRVLSYQHSAPALDACYQYHPALLITDIMRPNDIDGVTLCQQIRQDPLLHDLPLLILSARTDYCWHPLEDVAYVSKPCLTRNLVRIIDELVMVSHLG